MFVVVGEVDTGMGLVRVARDTEQLTLGLGILRTWNVLSITPLPISRSTCWRRRAVASTFAEATGGRVAVGVGVKGARGTLSWPAIADRSRSIATRLEVGCTGPFAAVAVHRA